MALPSVLEARCFVLAECDCDTASQKRFESAPRRADAKRSDDNTMNDWSVVDRASSRSARGLPLPPQT